MPGLLTRLSVNLLGFNDKGNACNVTIRPRLAANNGEALLQAAAQGLGVTRPPDFMAQPYLENGSVVSLLEAYEPDPLGIYAVLPSNRYIPHRVSVLIDFLAKEFLVYHPKT